MKQLRYFLSITVIIWFYSNKVTFASICTANSKKASHKLETIFSLISFYKFPLENYSTRNYLMILLLGIQNALQSQDYFLMCRVLNKPYLWFNFQSAHLFSNNIVPTSAKMKPDVDWTIVSFTDEWMNAWIFPKKWVEFILNWNNY